MKELKKPNQLESMYSELELQAECSLSSCPRLKCICDAIAAGQSPEEDEEIILA